MSNGRELAKFPANGYMRDNILGTVSETGGVPTGAIIERGSNANGEYVRFADGTQICTTIGKSYRVGTTVFTWPASFISPPIALPMIIPYYSMHAPTGWYGTPTAGNTYMNAVGGDGVAENILRMVGNGRWY